uniref:Uncharacterized protein n=1 Tax=Sphaeramia orbicularis TaxID=375764 RepID=A0A672YUQ3_9TELE
MFIWFHPYLIYDGGPSLTTACEYIITSVFQLKCLTTGSAPKWCGRFLCNSFRLPVCKNLQPQTAFTAPAVVESL